MSLSPRLELGAFWAGLFTQLAALLVAIQLVDEDAQPRMLLTVFDGFAWALGWLLVKISGVLDDDGPNYIRRRLGLSS